MMQPNLHENETKAAMVAIHLGCIEDAEKLYIKCKRYDLLAELYQVCIGHYVQNKGFPASFNVIYRN